MNLQHYLSSCFLLLIPVFVWNLAFGRSLPPSFQKVSWDRIPKEVAIAENVLRIVVFAFSIFLRLEIRNALQLAGLVIYVVGLLTYFISWVAQLRNPQSRWSRSTVGFCAPAYTSIIWLLGIALIGQQLLIDVWYGYWIYILLTTLFVAVHTLHSIFVHRKNF